MDHFRLVKQLYPCISLLLRKSIFRVINPRAYGFSEFIIFQVLKRKRVVWCCSNTGSTVIVTVRYNELWNILVLNTHLEEITHWPQYLSYRAIPIQDWFERWGRVLLNSSRSSCELIPTTVDLSDSLT